MLRLFKKQKGSTAPDERQEKLAERFVNVCLRMQTKWANWMNRKTAHLKVKTKFILLLVFVVFSGGYSVYLVVNSFMGKRSSTLSIDSIKKPKHVQQPGDELNAQNTFITEQEYQRIHRFRLYMDSLARSPYGKNRFDSIIVSRPGLMDSVFLIEKMYQSQTKK